MVFAVVADGVGVEGLLVLKCLLGVLVMTLIVIHGHRQRVGTLTLATVCVLTSVNLSFYWGLRPHMFTFALFAGLMAWLEWCFTDWSGRWHLPWPQNARTGNAPVGQATDPARLEVRRLQGLWLCPPLLAVWANTHGGFLAGLAIYLVILGCRGLEYALSRRSDRRRVLTQLCTCRSGGSGRHAAEPLRTGIASLATGGPERPTAGDPGVAPATAVGGFLDQALDLARVGGLGPGLFAASA